MATGTLSPDPKQSFFDTNGNPLVAGKLFTYLAGTTTPVATYTDVGLSVANANPIILDAAGRCVIYLSPGASYKYVLQDSTGAAVWTQDNISAVPAASGAQDDTGTAGEALTAGQAVYLSDGSGAKVAGQWYKADSANAYSSTTPAVGMVPASIVSGSSGTIRQAGQVTGLAGLTIGADYYVGTAGAITLTAPANARLLGRADTTSSLVLYGNPPKYGPGSSATLTNHGVVIGQATAAVVATTAGTAGQVLQSNGASADPSFVGGMTLLKANSGTSTAAGATNVDTIAISGLTAADMLLVKIVAISVTQATANIQLYNNTDAVAVTLPVASIGAGVTLMISNDIAQSQASTTSIDARYEGKDTVPTVYGSMNIAAFTTAWTGAWTLALRHGGVTAGGTLQWRWSVYKLAGQ